MAKPILLSYSRQIPPEIVRLMKQTGIAACLKGYSTSNYAGMYFAVSDTFYLDDCWELSLAAESLVSMLWLKRQPFILFDPILLAMSGDNRLALLHELGHHITWLAGEFGGSYPPGLQQEAHRLDGIMHGDYLASNFDETAAESIGRYLCGVELPPALRGLAERLIRKAAHKRPVLRRLIGNPIYQDVELPQITVVTQRVEGLSCGQKEDCFDRHC